MVRCTRSRVPLYNTPLTPRAVSKDFLAQVGDPTATGTGGESIWSLIASQSGGQTSAPRYFTPEFVPRFKHRARGTVSMAVAPAVGEEHQGGCGSQFFITLGDDIEYLDGKHAVFGHVVEGFDTLDKLNDIFVDQDGKPLKDVRIRHVEILGTSSSLFKCVYAPLTRGASCLSTRGPVRRPPGPHGS